MSVCTYIVYSILYTIDITKLSLYRWHIRVYKSYSVRVGVWDAFTIIYNVNIYKYVVIYITKHSVACWSGSSYYETNGCWVHTNGITY